MSSLTHLIFILHFLSCFGSCFASLFSDECLRSGLQSAYDATTDTCWIVEKTSLTFDMANTRCNHMPGYDGHLGFPKTTAQMNFLSAKFSSASWNGWVGLRHYGPYVAANVANRSEWYWTYPNGTLENAAAAPWYPTSQPAAGLSECAYPDNLGAALTVKPCTSALSGFYCQYDRSTAHHETMLEHKCKQLTNWFWWEPSKSCIIYDRFNRLPEFSKLACTHIPGYRGHMVHIPTVEKFASLMSLRDYIQPGVSIWLGMERDPNGTDPKSDVYWKRFDGYRMAFDFTPYAAYQTAGIDYVPVNYMYMGGDAINDWWDTTPAFNLCEYEETLRYAPSLLDIKCANLSLPHLYYKGSCFVREERYVTYDVAKTSCNHIDGFTGRLAVLPNANMLNIIYQTLTYPTGGYNYYWLGLERLNTTISNTSAGFYWLTGNGQSYLLTDYTAFYPGYPNGYNIGYGWLNFLGTAVNTYLWPFVCEYVEPTKGTHYRIQANFANTKTKPQAVISVWDDLSMQEMCGWQCTKLPTCNSIAFNANTRNCILQSVDSSVVSSYLTTAPGYVWYDRY